MQKSELGLWHSWRLSSRRSAVRAGPPSRPARARARRSGD